MKRGFSVSILLTILFLSPSFADPNPKMNDLCQGDADLAKLGGNLLLARQAMQTQKIAPDEALSRYHPESLRQGKLQCIVGVSDITKDLLEACAKVGLEVVDEYESPDMKAVVVRSSDLAQLEMLSHREDVSGIAPEPKFATHAGSVANQADVSMNADEVRSSLGFDGTGVRVGVLSDSVHDLLGGSLVGGILTGSAPQTSNDLPSQVRVVDPGPGTGDDEGAGMMELIYDLVPGANLSFASASSGYLAFADNIANLVEDPGYECDVLVDDVFYFAEPMYQDGPIAAAADTAFASGVPYFSSAGNLGDDAHERTYADANPGTDDGIFPPSGDDIHDFGTAVGLASNTHLFIVVPPDGEVNVILRWDEPYAGIFGAGPGSEADLDLYLTIDTNLPLLDPDTFPGNVNPPFDNVLSKSIALQGTVGSPAGEPIEVATYTNPSSVAVETIYVVVDHFQGREPVEVHVQVLGDVVNLDKTLASDRTVFGHTAAADVMAVAAMFYGEVDSGGSLDSPPGQLDVEPFSSLGGNLPFYFPVSGSPRLGSPELRFKPDITAPDGTNTTFFGTDIGFDADTDPNFFGTSAAAPHAAAVAALMLNADKDLSPGEVYSLMRSSALDAESPGQDPLAGDGLLDALLAVLATNPSLPASAENWNLYR